MSIPLTFEVEGNPDKYIRSQLRTYPDTMNREFLINLAEWYKHSNNIYNAYFRGVNINGESITGQIIYIDLFIADETNITVISDEFKINITEENLTNIITKPVAGIIKIINPEGTY